jgi:hypothetical protein
MAEPEPVRIVLSRKEFEEQMIAKAWTNEAFKKELLSDTKNVIERELNILVQEGIRIPEGIKMKVLEETPDQMYMVIPQSPKAVAEELSDDELEAVAGGTISIVAVAAVTVVAAVNVAAVVNAAGAVNIVAAVEEVETVVNIHHQVNVK